MGKVTVFTKVRIRDELTLEVFRKAYRQLLNTVPDETQILLIDNQTEEPWKKELYRFLSSFEVQVIRNEENNYCRAYNYGLLRAEGSYFFSVDADVIVYGGWMGELVSELTDEIGILLPSQLPVKVKSVDLLLRWPEEDRRSRYKHAYQFDKLNGSIWLARTEDLRRWGPFPEIFGNGGVEDKWLFYRCMEFGKQVARTQNCWVAHLQLATWANSDPGRRERSLANRKYIAQRYGVPLEQYHRLGFEKIQELNPEKVEVQGWQNFS